MQYHGMFSFSISPLSAEKKSKISKKRQKNGQFDARGTLAPLASPKFFFELDHTHTCCKVWNSEQVALFSGSVAPKLREKNESIIYTILIQTC